MSVKGDTIFLLDMMSIFYISAMITAIAPNVNAFQFIVLFSDFNNPNTLIAIAIKPRIFPKTKKPTMDNAKDK